MTWTMLGNRLKRRLEWYIVKLQIKSEMQICCSLGRSVIRSMSGHIWARPTRFSRAVNTYVLDGDRGRMAWDITRSFALSPSILQRGIVSRISHSAVGSLYSLVPDWRISSAGQIVALNTFLWDNHTNFGHCCVDVLTPWALLRSIVRLML